MDQKNTTDTTDTTNTKVCRVCGENKPYKEYHHRGGKPVNRCKVCTSEYEAEAYRRKKELGIAREKKTMHDDGDRIVGVTRDGVKVTAFQAYAKALMDSYRAKKAGVINKSTNPENDGGPVNSDNDSGLGLAAGGDAPAAPVVPEKRQEKNEEERVSYAAGRDPEYRTVHVDGAMVKRYRDSGMWYAMAYVESRGVSYIRKASRGFDTFEGALEKARRVAAAYESGVRDIAELKKA